MSRDDSNKILEISFCENLRRTGTGTRREEQDKDDDDEN